MSKYKRKGNEVIYSSDSDNEEKKTLSHKRKQSNSSERYKSLISINQQKNTDPWLRQKTTFAHVPRAQNSNLSSKSRKVTNNEESGVGISSNLNQIEIIQGYQIEQNFERSAPVTDNSVFEVPYQSRNQMNDTNESKKSLRPLYEQRYGKGKNSQNSLLEESIKVVDSMRSNTERSRIVLLNEQDTVNYQFEEEAKVEEDQLETIQVKDDEEKEISPEKVHDQDIQKHDEIVTVRTIENQTIEILTKTEETPQIPSPQKSAKAEIKYITSQNVNAQPKLTPQSELSIKLTPKNEIPKNMTPKVSEKPPIQKKKTSLPFEKSPPKETEKEDENEVIEKKEPTQPQIKYEETPYQNLKQKSSQKLVSLQIQPDMETPPDQMPEKNPKTFVQSQQNFMKYLKDINIDSPSKQSKGQASGLTKTPTFSSKDEIDISEQQIVISTHPVQMQMQISSQENSSRIVKKETKKSSSFTINAEFDKVVKERTPINLREEQKITMVHESSRTNPNSIRNFKIVTSNQDKIEEKYSDRSASDTENLHNSFRTFPKEKKWKRGDSASSGRQKYDSDGISQERSKSINRKSVAAMTDKTYVKGKVTQNTLNIQTSQELNKKMKKSQKPYKSNKNLQSPRIHDSVTINATSTEKTLQLKSEVSSNNMRQTQPFIKKELLKSDNQLSTNDERLNMDLTAIQGNMDTDRKLVQEAMISVERGTMSYDISAHDSIFKVERGSNKVVSSQRDFNIKKSSKKSQSDISGGVKSSLKEKFSNRKSSNESRKSQDSSNSQRKQLKSQKSKRTSSKASSKQNVLSKKTQDLIKIHNQSLMIEEFDKTVEISKTDKNNDYQADQDEQAPQQNRSMKSSLATPFDINQVIYERTVEHSQDISAQQSRQLLDVEGLKLQQPPSLIELINDHFKSPKSTQYSNIIDQILDNVFIMVDQKKYLEETPTHQHQLESKTQVVARYNLDQIKESLSAEELSRKQTENENDRRFEKTPDSLTDRKKYESLQLSYRDVNPSQHEENINQIILSSPKQNILIEISPKEKKSGQHSSRDKIKQNSHIFNNEYGFNKSQTKSPKSRLTGTVNESQLSDRTLRSSNKPVVCIEANVYIRGSSQGSSQQINSLKQKKRVKNERNTNDTRETDQSQELFHKSAQNSEIRFGQQVIQSTEQSQQSRSNLAPYQNLDPARISHQIPQQHIPRIQQQPYPYNSLNLRNVASDHKMRIKHKINEKYGSKLDGRQQYINRLSVEPQKPRVLNSIQKARVGNYTVNDYSPPNEMRRTNGSGDFQVQKDFKLKNFIQKYDLMGIFKNSIQAAKYVLPIRDFHYKNGIMKNRIPKNNDRYQNQQILNFNTVNRSFDQNPLLTGDDNSNSPRQKVIEKYQKQFHNAIKNGQIDIDSTYLLIQCIGREMGEKTLSDVEVKDHAHALADGSRERSNSLIKQYKWRQIMRFMTKNPQILMQMVSIHESNHSSNTLEGNTPNQFFSRRPRYTEKVLQQIYQDVPGLMDYVNKQTLPSSLTFSQDQIPRKQAPTVIPKVKKNLRTISKESKKNRPIIPAVHIPSLERKKKGKKETCLRIHKRLQQQSISPSDMRQLKDARRALDEVNSTLRNKSNSNKKTKKQQYRSLNPLGTSQREPKQQYELPNVDQTSVSIQLKKLKSLNPPPQVVDPYGQPSQVQSRKLQMPSYGQSPTISVPASDSISPIRNNNDLKLDKLVERDVMKSNIFDQKQQSIPMSQNAERTSGMEIQKMMDRMARKPQTNERSVRKKVHGEHNFINYRSANDTGAIEDHFPQPMGPDQFCYDIQARKTFVGGMTDPLMPPIYNRNNNQTQYQSQFDRRTELTSGGSIIPSKFEELIKQQKQIEDEELELNAQRKQIVSEKNKINKQLQRIDKKEELMAQEEQVRKRRLMLEIEKKKLREDISELDSLKNMLEKRKKDTHVGFSELAESNKELKSLRSGDLHRERSMYSRQSAIRQNAKNSSLPDSGSYPSNQNYESAQNKTNGFTAYTNDRLFPISDGKKTPLENNFDRANQPEALNEPKRLLTYNESTNHIQNNEIEPYIVEQEQELNQTMYKSQEDNEKIMARVTQSPSIFDQQTRNGKREKSPMQSEANLTFISGAGVFDWAQSTIMDDVYKSQEKFKPEENSIGNPLYSEDQIFEMIETVKNNPKSLRSPDQLKLVYQQAMDTLQELMSQMNQMILFQMIARKYSEANLDNTIKLLVRCKQLLQSRKQTYTTLRGIREFEQQSIAVKRQIEDFLEKSPRESVLAKLQIQAMDVLPKLAQDVIVNISELRDHYKLFSKMGATTSKGNQVLNVMAYKRRDATRYILREYDSIKKLIQVVDINMPPIQRK